MSPDKVPFSHPWKEKYIHDVADVIVGGTPSTEKLEYWGGDVPWMASGDVHLKRIIDVPGRITELGLRSSNAKMVDPPAVAIALAGQGKTRGTAALTATKICTNQSVALIKPFDESLFTEYLYYALDYRYEELRGRSDGAGRAGLNKALLESIPVPIPSRVEQETIARVLSTVDQAIEEAKALIAKHRRIKVGLMHDLLTRGVNEEGEIRDPALHSFVRTEIGFLPHSWQIKPLSTVAEVNSGLTLGRKVFGPDAIEVPYLRVANVQDGYLDLTEIKTVQIYRSELPRYLLEPGDVLMNEGGDFDKLGRGTVWTGQIAPCAHQNHVFRVRPKKDHLISEYLAYVSGSPYGKKFFVLSSKQSTNLASINSTQLKAFPIPCPPLEEQAKIVEIMSAFDATMNDNAFHYQKLKAVKNGLMQDLLTGKVSVESLL